MNNLKFYYDVILVYTIAFHLYIYFIYDKFKLFLREEYVFYNMI